MRSITKFSLLLLLVGANALAANSPQNLNAAQTGSGVDSAVPSNSVPSGSRGDRFLLISSMTTATSGNYYRFVKAGAQATSQENYQVTTTVNGNPAKGVFCDGFYFSADANSRIGFGYGTAAVTNDNSAAPAGERLYYAGTVGSFYTPAISSGYKYIAMPISFTVSSYPFVKNLAANSSIAINMICTEE
jgi:hypothetical protein